MEQSENVVMEAPAQEVKGSFPEALEGVDWKQCRMACEAGLDLKEASDIFKVSYEALRKRAQREEWLHPAKLQALRNEKKQEVMLSQACPIGQKPVLTAKEALTETLEGHRSQTLLGLAKLAGKGISRAMQADLPIENWQDAKIVADIAMKLHNVGQEGVNVNVLVGGDGGFDGPVIENGALDGPDSALDYDDDMDE